MFPGKPAKRLGKFEETAFKDLVSYPDMEISIIIYRLSDIYLSQIRIRLFGTISDLLLNTIEFRE
jgi:hypothetical protein